MKFFNYVITRQFILFVLVGGLGSIVYFGLLSGLTRWFGVVPVTALGIAFIAQQVTGFFCNKFFVFSNEDLQKIYEQIGWYLGMMIFCFAFNESFLWIGTEYIHLAPETTQIISNPILTVLVFPLNKKVFS